MDPLGQIDNAVAVPVYLDDDSEMLVGMMMINPEFAPHFDLCPPMRTHKRKCPEHGQHVDHYSLPSGKVNISITITEKAPQT